MLRSLTIQTQWHANGCLIMKWWRIHFTVEPPTGKGSAKGQRGSPGSKGKEKGKAEKGKAEKSHTPGSAHGRTLSYCMKCMEFTALHLDLFSLSFFTSVNQKHETLFVWFWIMGTISFSNSLSLFMEFLWYYCLVLCFVFVVLPVINFEYGCIIEWIFYNLKCKTMLHGIRYIVKLKANKCRTLTYSRIWLPFNFANFS